MRRRDITVVGGLLLVIVGTLAMLWSLDAVALDWELLVGAILAVGGLAFLMVYGRNRAHWWAVIPGFSLLAFAVVIGLESSASRAVRAWNGAVFLGTIGLGFWVVYIGRREFWWAVIPGGTLFTLALVAGLAQTRPGMEVGGAFFLGIGLTFGLLYMLNLRRRMAWALIPAAVCFLFGLLLVLAAVAALEYVWPALLVLAGLAVLLRGFLRPSSR
jgi:hypothetical protein